MMTHGEVCKVVKNLFTVIGEDKLGRPVDVKDVLVSAVASQVATHPDGKPYEIQIICKNWIANQLSGWVDRYPDHAEIYYSTSLNCCWGRWVICKELAHLLIDTKEQHYTQDPTNLVRELISGLNVDNEQINSEHLAMIAAIEMMFPIKHRAEMEQMMSNGKTDYEIAHSFRAPEVFVNLLLRSPFGEMSKVANA